jgi:hypothetical protein
MPCPINVIMDAMDHFEEQHKDCKPETVMSDYIKGFDHGCDYIVAEIERYTKAANSHDALVLAELLARLKMEKTNEQN